MTTTTARNIAPSAKVLAGIGIFMLTCAILLGLFSLTNYLRTRDYGNEVASAQGVTRLDISGDPENLEVVCGQVDKFVLEQKNVRKKTTIERDGDVLKVSAPSTPWYRDIVVSFHSPTLKLTMPRDVCDGRLSVKTRVGSADLRIESKMKDVSLKSGSGNTKFVGTAESLTSNVGSGEIDVDAKVKKDVSLEAGSGDLKFAGTARSLSGKVGSGQINVDATVKGRAKLKASSGDVSGQINSVPDSLSVEVGSGDVRLALPRGLYFVKSDVGSGEFNNKLDIDKSGKPCDIDVKVGSGDVNLKRLAK
ncbi:MAG: DUF4097 family beta strand repeat-containing protein [Actinomycetaceae bacterium]|nr:DUF4097 family beta strand repeat-containing protein [Actinomycetaceae bacterium]